MRNCYQLWDSISHGYSRVYCTSSVPLFRELAYECLFKGHKNSHMFHGRFYKTILLAKTNMLISVIHCGQNMN